MDGEHTVAVASHSVIPVTLATCHQFSVFVILASSTSPSIQSTISSPSCSFCFSCEQTRIVYSNEWKGYTKVDGHIKKRGLFIHSWLDNWMENISSLSLVKVLYPWLLPHVISSLSLSFLYPALLHLFNQRSVLHTSSQLSLTNPSNQRSVLHPTNQGLVLYPSSRRSGLYLANGRLVIHPYDKHFVYPIHDQFSLDTTAAATKR